jgi:hypothetical protein
LIHPILLIKGNFVMSLNDIQISRKTTFISVLVIAVLTGVIFWYVGGKPGNVNPPRELIKAEHQRIGQDIMRVRPVQKK